MCPPGSKHGQIFEFFAIGEHRFGKPLTGSAPSLTCRCVIFFCKSSCVGTCYVTRAADRPVTGTIVVPAEADQCLPGPDRTNSSGAIPENAWTQRRTED